MIITLVMKMMTVLMIKMILNFKQNYSHHTDDGSLTRISLDLLYNKCCIPPVNIDKKGIMQSHCVTS